MTSIPIGKILKPFGLKGILKFLQYNLSLEILDLPIVVLVQHPISKLSFEEKLISFKKSNTVFLIQFENRNQIDHVEMFRNFEILVDSSILLKKKKEEEFYIFEILGFSVIVSDSDISTGFFLEEVIENGEQNLFVFKNEKNQKIMIPYVDKHIGKISLVEKTIEVKDWMNWFEI